MSTAAPRIPIRLAVGLALAIALDTAVQLLWKSAVADVPPATSMSFTVEAVLQQPMFIVVGVLMIVQLINWLKVLGNADLSYAKPITSLSYVTVSVGSVVLLGETIHPLQIAGILIVIAGVWLISQTGHSGARKETEDR